MRRTRFRLRRHRHAIVAIGAFTMSIAALGVLAATGPNDSEVFCTLGIEIRPDGSRWGADPRNGCRPRQLQPPTTQG